MMVKTMVRMTTSVAPNVRERSLRREESNNIVGFLIGSHYGLSPSDFFLVHPVLTECRRVAADCFERCGRCEPGPQAACSAERCDGAGRFPAQGGAQPVPASFAAGEGRACPGVGGLRSLGQGLQSGGCTRVFTTQRSRCQACCRGAGR